MFYDGEECLGGGVIEKVYRDGEDLNAQDHAHCPNLCQGAARLMDIETQLQAKCRYIIFRNEANQYTVARFSARMKKGSSLLRPDIFLIWKQM